MLGIIIVILFECKDYSKSTLELENKHYKDNMVLHETICKLEDRIYNQSKQVEDLYVLFKQLQLCVGKRNQ